MSHMTDVQWLVFTAWFLIICNIGFRILNRRQLAAIIKQQADGNRPIEPLVAARKSNSCQCGACPGGCVAESKP